ncbi:hypothetical protein QBC40DRAFT_67393 [Triangularia verruculosa]|uniref:Uncharacterized protein n=1 Tax=Triangularia verruculosa TaxID=2587418 RepID=A0AAN7ATT0_9PEZI|nr:hypothetical protein QBC40DRAFT_67393 [Triangularia verruculosa]
MGEKKDLLPAWDKGRTDFGRFQLNLKAWCYVDPLEVHDITAKVAKFLHERQYVLLAEWQITVQEPTPQTPITPLAGRDGLTYLALNLTFMTTDGGPKKLASERWCRKRYNELASTLLRPSFEVSRKKIGIEFVTWDLTASWGWTPAFSLYWLLPGQRSSTAQSKTLPAHNIGYVLRDLLALPELGARDRSHDGCSRGAVLECIKHLLRKAQQELANVRQAASTTLKQSFAALDCDGCYCWKLQNITAAIQDNIKHAVASNASIQAIIHLLNQNVGISQSRFFLMRLLRYIFKKPKHLNVAVNDKAFKTKKQTMVGHATDFKILSKTVAGHIRLRGKDNRRKLVAEVQMAQTGTLEQTQLMSYFGLAAARIGEQAQHDAALDKVCGRYFAEFDIVVSDIEGLIQILDKEYAEKGEKMFRKKRSAVPEGTPRCKLEKMALAEKLYKLENDSDSELDVELNEKC